MLRISKPIKLECAWPKSHFTGKARSGRINENGVASMISWEADADSTIPWERSPAETAIVRLNGVKSISDAVAHFQLLTGISKTVPKQATYPFGTLIQIDSSTAGFRPGNTYFYLIASDARQGAVFLGPCWFLDFDWAHAIVHFQFRE